MKVLMQSRVDLFDKRGGDTVHLENTKKELEKLGVEVVVSLENNPNLGDFDIVHIFNIDWVRETYLQSLNAKRQGKKLVITPIHHRFSEIEEFEKYSRFDFRRLINPIFRTYESREYLKNIYRCFFDPRKIKPTLIQLRVGLRKQQIEVCKMADLLLPNTKLEEEEIKKEFKVAIKSVVVPAGVSENFKGANPEWFLRNFEFVSRSLLGEFVLCVGRIEPRKNQLKIIGAVEGTGIPLILVGKFNPFHPEYVLRVEKKITRSANIFHIEEIPYRSIASAFAACKVHVLASWFETTGLVNLEAGLAGANVVSTNRGYCSEYLKGMAFYVDPRSVFSIREGILKAFSHDRTTHLRRHILKNYTWKKVGEKTLKAYLL